MDNRALAERVVLRYKRALLEYGYGLKGKGLSWQGDFPPTTPCVKCGKPAELALVVREGHDEGKDFQDSDLVTHMHPNNEVVNGEKLFWLHDCGAFATYVCRDFNCTTTTTLWNQA
jgi:hypothetical protein